MKQFFLILLAFCLPLFVQAADFDVTVEKDQYAPGEDIHIDWTTPTSTNNSGNWVAIFRPSDSNQQYRDWAYTSRSTEGSLTLNEQKVGEYEVRLLRNYGYTAVATSIPFTIAAADAPDDPDEPTDSPEASYELDVSTSNIQPGQSVTLDWSVNADNLSSDWIGLYRTDASNRSYTKWFYAGSETGSRTVTIDDTGDFEFRYLKNNGYTSVATSPVITVEDPETEPEDPEDPADPEDPEDPETPPSSEYSLSLNTTQIEIGDSVTLTYQADSTDNLSSDWIGLYRTDASNRSYTKWFYAGSETGSRTVTIDDTGDFEFRYLKNNGYTSVATSPVITVEDPETEPEDPEDPATPPSSEYSVAADQDTYQVDTIADAVWSAPSGANIAFDWIGLYRTGASDNRYLDYEYVDTFSFREQFLLSQIGTYEFRYFKNNTYQKVATSEPFTVTEGGVNTCNGYNLDTVTNYPSDNGPVIALGDSITFGIGASDNENYVEELEKRLNINIINEGVPADTTEDVLNRLESDVLNRDPRTVIVFIGGNDELRRIYESLNDSAADRQLEDTLDNFVRNRLDYQWDRVPLLTRAETFENLETIITRIQATGATTIVVGFDNTLYNDSIETNYARIANETGSIYIPDIYDGIFGRPSRMSDLVHPNDVGYDIIADRIEQGLACLVN